MGFSLFWKAPLVLGLIVVPEFAQHVAEIRLGMFESREAFIELQHDPTRWAFGYAKVAGLFLAMLAAVRFWGVRDHGARWWDLRGIGWRRFLLGAMLFFGVGSAPELLAGQVAAPAYQAIGAGWAILLLPALFILLAGLVGDRHTPLGDVWLRSWPWLVVTLVLAALGFGPSAWLHTMNHEWAFGAGPVTLWGLMIFDSMLVGLLAGLVGTALYLGYAGYAGRNRGGSAGRAEPGLDAAD